MAIPAKEHSHKNVKIIIFSLFLIASSYYFGGLLFSAGISYQMLIHPSYDFYSLLVHFVLSVSCVIISVSIIAGLFKNVSLIFLLSIFSSIAVMFGWQVFGTNNMLYLLLFSLGLFIYIVGTKIDLEQRIKFSTFPLRHGRGTLVTMLAFFVALSVYSGYSIYINQHGLQFSQKYIQGAVEYIEDIAYQSLPLEKIPEQQKELLVTQTRSEIEETLDATYEKGLKPNEKHVPLFFAFMIFFPLMGIIKVITIILDILIEIIFALLKTSKITRIKKDWKEVERLTID